MARGYYCTKCGGSVDGNEYDFSKDMCKECVSEIEQEQIVKAEVSKLLNGKYEQIELEDLINVN